ncbi:hypothetical protein [Anaerotruncus colihominis]|nr:hypothetical protein [Anaerotruncus colihominis]
MNDYPSDYVERNRLDAFCKAVLRNGVRCCLLELARCCDREKPMGYLAAG